MKKLIILCLMCLITDISMAQAVADSTTQDLKTTIYNDAKAAIESIASALKIGSEHVYAVLVKQQIVNSITLLIVYLVSFGVIFFLAKKASKFPPYDDRSNSEDNAFQWYLIPAILLAFIWIIFFLVTIQIVVTGFVNPEYGAIEKIMELLN